MALDLLLPQYGLSREAGETDARGIPAHSIAVVTRGGEPEAIGQAVWEKKAPGIGTWGSMTVNAFDREGNPHPVSFTLLYGQGDLCLPLYPCPAGR